MIFYIREEILPCFFTFIFKERTDHEVFHHICIRHSIDIDDCCFFRIYFFIVLRSFHYSFRNCFSTYITVYVIACIRICLPFRRTAYVTVRICICLPLRSTAYVTVCIRICLLFHNTVCVTVCICICLLFHNTLYISGVSYIKYILYNIPAPV